jgi:hypothetical protein
MYDFGAVAGPLMAAAKNPLAMNNISISWAYRNALWARKSVNLMLDEPELMVRITGLIPLWIVGGALTTAP